MARNNNFMSSLYMNTAPSNTSLQNSATQCASNATVMKCSKISAMPLIGATRPGPGQSLYLIPMIIDHKLYYLSSGVRKSTTEIDITYKNYAKVVKPIYLSAGTETGNEKKIQQSSKKIINEKACDAVVKNKPSDSGDACDLREEGRSLATENQKQKKQNLTQQSSKIVINEKACDTVVKTKLSNSGDANVLLEEDSSLANEDPIQNKQNSIQQSSRKIINEKVCDVVKIEPSDSDDTNDLREEQAKNQDKQKIIQQSSKKVINEKLCDIVIKIEPSDIDDPINLFEENKSTHEECSSFENINLKTEIFCFQGAEIKKETLEETLSNCTTEEDDSHTNADSHAIVEHFDGDTEQNKSIVKSGQKRKVQTEIPIQEPQYTCDSINSKMRGVMCNKRVFVYKRKRSVYDYE